MTSPLSMRPRVRRLPQRADHWPAAIRSAELLRGTLVRCGPGLRYAAWPETPLVRATALAPWLTTERIAVSLTAAWVWGAVRSPGTPLEFATTHARREREPRTAACVLHQFRGLDAEMQQLGEFRVTTPERTVMDLLRASPRPDRTTRIACRLLLTQCPAGREGVRDLLLERKGRYHRVALQRLDAV